MKILETERLVLREITEADDEFILELLNQPSFIRFIGDRNVKTLESAREFIETRYRKSYAENGFGLYLVELKPGVMPTAICHRSTATPIGICGFVRREGLPDADIGFAFLPQFEKNGFAFESASAVMKYGREKLNLEKVLAITTEDNHGSIRLLEKIGFRFERLIKLPHDAEQLKLFSYP